MAKKKAKTPEKKDSVDLKTVYSICGDCAQANGATWPEGHCATFSVHKCDVCKEEKACCARNDWDWPNKKLSFNREF